MPVRNGRAGAYAPRPCPACPRPAPAADPSRTTSRGSAAGSSASAAKARSESTSGGAAQSVGCTTATTRSPHSRVRPADHGAGRDAGMPAEHPLHHAAGTLTPPVTTTSSARPTHLEPPVRERAAEVLRHEPAVDQRLGREVRPQPVAGEHHRAAELDPAVVPQPHRHAVQRLAVVHAAAAGLRHPVRRHDGHPRVDGRGVQRRGQRRPADQHTVVRREVRRPRRAVVGAGSAPATCSDVRRGAAVRSRRRTPPPRSRRTGRGPPAGVRASSERTSTVSPATWVTGSASSHCPGPPSRAWVARAECRSASEVSIVPFGSPVDPDVGTTSATSSRSSGCVGSSAASTAPRPPPVGSGSSAGPAPSSAAASAGTRVVRTASPVGAVSPRSSRGTQ